MCINLRLRQLLLRLWCVARLVEIEGLIHKVCCSEIFILVNGEVTGFVRLLLSCYVDVMSLCCLHGLASFKVEDIGFDCTERVVIRDIEAIGILSGLRCLLHDRDSLSRLHNFKRRFNLS